MIAPRRPINQLKAPPRREPSNRIQLNRLFDDEAEMRAYINANCPGAVIKQFWPVQQLKCIIELPVKSESKGKKK